MTVLAVGFTALAWLWWLLAWGERDDYHSMRFCLWMAVLAAGAGVAFTVGGLVWDRL